MYLVYIISIYSIYKTNREQIQSNPKTFMKHNAYNATKVVIFLQNRNIAFNTTNEKAS